MKNIAILNKKTIEKYKKKVHKQYPGAYLKKLSNGYYTVVQENEDLSTKDILAEFCFYPTKDPVKAWELAQVSSKSEQNLNRTHPLRIEGQNLEDKLARIEQRKSKSEGTMKKSKHDIY
jgi:hypothetical protein